MNKFQIIGRSLRLPAVMLIAFAGGPSAATEPARTAPQYLYLWTASAAESQPDFLALSLQGVVSTTLN